MKVLIAILTTFLAYTANANEWGARNYLGKIEKGYTSALRWNQALDSNRISYNDYDYLLKGQTSLFKMELLACEGITLNANKCANNFKNGLKKFVKKGHRNNSAVNIINSATGALNSYTVER